jgi:hypothetical protein
MRYHTLLRRREVTLDLLLCMQALRDAIDDCNLSDFSLTNEGWNLMLVDIVPHNMKYTTCQIIDQ